MKEAKSIKEIMEIIKKDYFRSVKNCEYEFAGHGISEADEHGDFSARIVPTERDDLDLLEISYYFMHPSNSSQNRWCDFSIFIEKSTEESVKAHEERMERISAKIKEEEEQRRLRPFYRNPMKIRAEVNF